METDKTKEPFLITESYLIKMVEQGIAEIEGKLPALSPEKREYQQEVVLKTLYKIREEGSYLKNSELINKFLATGGAINQFNHNPLRKTSDKIVDLFIKDKL